MSGSISRPAPTQHQEQNDSALRQIGGTLYASTVTAEAAVIILSLGVAGAVIALVALVAMPSERLETPAARADRVEAGFAS